jgi:hypothetical protein
MTTFLTSDTHFGHALMLKLEACARPFANTDEMDQCLIDNWNAFVHPNDTVWHLGDFAMRQDERRVAQIFHALNGVKKLIIGNHDVDKKGALLPSLKRLPWAEVAHAAEITQTASASCCRITPAMSGMPSTGAPIRHSATVMARFWGYRLHRRRRSRQDGGDRIRTGLPPAA